MSRAFSDGTERVLTEGARYRGAPDWGPAGIVFTELDGAKLSIVVIQPDGTRKVPMTVPSTQSLTSVRWLP